jgi:multicomponent Na+:H+ antiporter subunit C
MTAFMLALLVGVLFACGTFLILQRGQIKLVLGLGLISHGVNLALFGTGKLTRGAPAILPHEGNLTTILATQTFADPLPQALILTAIVISFGVTAFIVVLVSRRDAFTGGDLAPGELASILNTADPFVGRDTGSDEMDHTDDYDVLQYDLDEVYDRPGAAAEIAHEEI